MCECKRRYLATSKTIGRGFEVKTFKYTFFDSGDCKNNNLNLIIRVSCISESAGVMTTAESPEFGLSSRHKKKALTYLEFQKNYISNFHFPAHWNFSGNSSSLTLIFNYDFTYARYFHFGFEFSLQTKYSLPPPKKDKHLT